MFNVWLYGIMVTQTTWYYVTYKTDRTWIKWMVAWLFVIDTLNTIFDIGLIWRYTITLFGNVEEILHSHWLFNVEPTMITSTIQSFYAWRVARLTGYAWMGWALGFLAFVQFGAGLGSTIWASFLVDFSRFTEGKPVVITWLVLSALTDTFITCALSWHLLTNRTGFPETDDIITRVVRMTVQTALITTLWATVNLIFFVAVPNNLHLFFQLSLGKLYINTLMSTLNSRRGWGGSLTSGDGDDGEPTSRSGGDSGQGHRSTCVWRTERSHKSTTVHITTTVHREDHFELNDYVAEESKRVSAENIEGYTEPDSEAAVQFPGTKLKSALSDVTSTHSGMSSDKR
ncbi:hypothetical protein FS749_016748 [Ceratobasidium sp. UAMH 11750]|nr:hypothetical protein FS749_016748 [Ceratobasidium sp. UAMH 11750]